MNSSASQRREDRSTRKIAVTLFSIDPVTYEVATTRDVSPHGASVLTGKPCPLNDLVNVRAHEYTFIALARVVWCRPEKDGSYALGLEFVFTTGDWMKSRWQVTAPWTSAPSLST
jgi:PilZ domain-containing protein